MTLKEKLSGQLANKKYVIAWTYSDHIRSWGSVQDEALIAAKFGMDVTFAYPVGFDLDEATMDQVKKSASTNGSRLEISHDLEEALSDANVVFPRSWASHDCVKSGMNVFDKEKEIVEHNKYKDWILNERMLNLMDRNALVTHVLPVFRGQEATDEVMDGPHSVIFDQAENLLYLRAAVLALVAGRKS